MILLNMKTAHSHNNKADYIGILGSILCIIHCLLVPVITIGSSLEHMHTHQAGLLSLDLLFVVVNGIAVYFATKDHKSLPLRLLLWSALALFSVSILLESRLPVFTWLGYAGSALLIIGHFVNLYQCQIAPRLKFKF